MTFEMVWISHYLHQMKSLLIIFFSLNALAVQNTLEIDLEKCAPETSADAKLTANDYIWDYTFDSMAQAFQQINNQSDKRLPRRMYWDADQKALILPYETARGGGVKVPSQFIENIKNHILTAYSQKYIDYVFFPDMGHSHFLIPNAKWNKIYNPIPVNQFSRMYEKMLADKDLKILYHTAEQLKTLDSQDQVLPDAHVQWRHKTRNIMGLNNGKKPLVILQNPASKANTVDEYPGHKWWGSGFNISANSNGCINLKKENGDELRFDLSLYDLIEN